MENLFSVNVSQPSFEGKLTHKELQLTGNVNLSVLEMLKKYEYDFLDISQAEFGTDQEEWAVCLGWSHCGPVYGNSGWRDVEVLKRFLEEISAKAILLPDSVQRRHINAAKKNSDIKELRVSNDCPIFAYEGGKLMNKKKTKPVFGCKAYTITGEIRGEWNTYHPTVDIILSDAEVEQIRSGKGLDEVNPQLSDYLDDYFGSLAWKQVVKDGMAYYNLTRKEAEEAEMTGDEYSWSLPKYLEQ
jgi:hypothetical protein